jgi:hypothetical protein
MLHTNASQMEHDIYIPKQRSHQFCIAYISRNQVDVVTHAVQIFPPSIDQIVHHTHPEAARD